MRMTTVAPSRGGENGGRKETEKKKGVSAGLVNQALLSIECGRRLPAPCWWYLDNFNSESNSFHAIGTRTLKAFHNPAQGCPTFVGLPWVRIQHDIGTL